MNLRKKFLHKLALLWVGFSALSALAFGNANSLQANEGYYNGGYANEGYYNGGYTDGCCGDWYTDSNECNDSFWWCPPNGYGEWLPEAPPLFRPFKADPRQITFSIGWRFNDKIFNKNLVDVSYGDDIPIYRWYNVGPCNGQLQIAIEGAVWALFEPTEESAPLVDADYYVGIPITYAFDCWSFRLRGYHISTHLGDELLLNELRDDPDFERLNPSAEFLEFHASYYYCDFRFYAGVGAIIHNDHSFPRRRWYFEAGIEQYLSNWAHQFTCNRLLGRPFWAIHGNFHNDHHWSPDMTYVAGYELKKTCGLGRALRLFGEYHHGYSLEGQFSKERTHYWSIRLSYGF